VTHSTYRDHGGDQAQAHLAEDISNRGAADTANPQLAELAHNTSVTPAGLFGDGDSHFADRFERLRPTDLLGLPAAVLLTVPSLVGPRVDNRNQVACPEPIALPSLMSRSHSFLDGKEYLPLGHARQQHLVFCVKELDLSAELVLSAARQEEQQRLKKPPHFSRVSVIQ
jgi:hypothetical protein